MYLKSKLAYVLVVSGLCIFRPLGAQTNTPFVSLQQLINGMHSNYELLKAQGNLVQAKQAAGKAVALNRLPRLNALFQATVASNNGTVGDDITYSVIPSISGGNRPENNYTAVSGDVGFAGLNWEALNFGKYKAQEKLAQSDVVMQTNILASTQYDLDGVAAAYYAELIHQYELETIQSNNVARLKQLKASVMALVNSGTRPGVDSAVAAVELSKALVSYYEAQKNFEQLKVQLSNLTSLPPATLTPDTTAEERVMQNGMAFSLSTSADTAHHPYINLYSSMYDYSKARLKLEKSSYYPKLFVDADGWMRGSGINNSDQYNSNLLAGYEPSRFNYLVGLTFEYDIFNIVHKRFNSNIYRYQADAAYHQLQNEKQNLESSVQQAAIEKDYQFKRVDETKRQLDAATNAYQQQLSLYNSGLSSIIELNTALDYYLRSQLDYSGAKSGLMRSILNYSLVTNSFNTLLQTFKL